MFAGQGGSASRADRELCQTDSVLSTRALGGGGRGYGHVNNQNHEVIAFIRAEPEVRRSFFDLLPKTQIKALNESEPCRERACAESLSRGSLRSGGVWLVGQQKRVNQRARTLTRSREPSLWRKTQKYQNCPGANNNRTKRLTTFYHTLEASLQTYTL